MIALLAAALLAVQENPDPLDRLIAELKSPVKERRELATFALRAYGGAAIDRLKAAKIDLGFVDGGGPTKENRDVADKLKAIRITIDMQNAPLSSIVAYIGEISGLNVWIDKQAIPDAGKELISFKVQDIVLDGALKLMLGPREQVYVIRNGGVVITKSGAPESLPSRWPIRISADAPDARRLVTGLSGETPEDRERALDGLRRLGFAAERTLWDSLDVKDAETHGRILDLLHELYTPDPPAEPPPLERRLQAKPLRFHADKSSALEILGAFSESANISLVVDARIRLPSQPVTVHSHQEPADQVLAAVAGELRLNRVFVGNWVWLTTSPQLAVGTRPYGPTWLSPDEAQSAEAMIRHLAAGDDAARAAASDKLLASGPHVLGPLLQASRILPPPAAARCRTARERYVDAHELWLADEPAGAERRALSDEQRALLDAPLDLVAQDLPLGEILRKTGLEVTVKVQTDRRHHVWARRMKTVDLLKSLTGPYGLDFLLEGRTVVIDTVANVRAALAK